MPTASPTPALLPFRPLGAICLATLIAACGGGDDDPSTPPGDSLPEAASTFAGTWVSTRCSASNSRERLQASKTGDNRLSATRGVTQYAGTGCTGRVASESSQPNPSNVQFEGLITHEGVKFARGTNAGAAEVWGLDTERRLLCRLTGSEVSAGASDAALVDRLNAKADANDCYQPFVAPVPGPSPDPDPSPDPGVGTGAALLGQYWSPGNGCTSTDGGHALPNSQSKRGVTSVYPGDNAMTVRVREQWYEYTGPGCTGQATLLDIVGIPVGSADEIITLQPAQRIGGHNAHRFTSASHTGSGSISYNAGVLTTLGGGKLCMAWSSVMTPSPAPLPSDAEAAELMQVITAEPARQCLPRIVSPTQM